MWQKKLNASETVNLYVEAYGEEGAGLLLGALFVYIPEDKISMLIGQAERALGVKQKF